MVNKIIFYHSATVAVIVCIYLLNQQTDAYTAHDVVFIRESETIYVLQITMRERDSAPHPNVIKGITKL